MKLTPESIPNKISRQVKVCGNRNIMNIHIYANRKNTSVKIGNFLEDLLMINIYEITATLKIMKKIVRKSIIIFFRFYGLYSFVVFGLNTCISNYGKMLLEQNWGKLVKNI